MSNTSYDDSFFDQQSAGSLASARLVLAALFRIVPPARSVADVGCGVAPWLRVARELGAERGLGIDGDYVDRGRLLVEPALFRHCDLENGSLAEVAAGEHFDLAICMEVAEHLSDARAAGFVRELCGLSELVLFSAAIPEQGGTHHINEQWPGYWSALFRQEGFLCFDLLRPRLWNEAGCEWWYLQNVLIFAKEGSAAAASLAQVGSPVAEPLALVHPRKLRHALDEWQERATIFEQLSHYQPFGRDEGIRAVEAKADAMRAMVDARQVELEAAQAAVSASQGEQASMALALEAARGELARAAETGAALRASTSWRLTAPLRWAMRQVRG
jgi:SAM-dependent methyltransferase